MTRISIEKAHALPLHETRARADRALERLKGPMGLKGAWRGDVYEFSKPTAGRLTLSPDYIRVEVVVGPGLRVARSSIEKRLHAEIEHWLGESRGGDLSRFASHYPLPLFLASVGAGFLLGWALGRSPTDVARRPS